MVAPPKPITLMKFVYSRTRVENIKVDYMALMIPWEWTSEILLLSEWAAPSPEVGAG